MELLSAQSLGPGLTGPLSSESDWEALRRRLWTNDRLNLNPGTIGTPSHIVAEARAGFAKQFEGWPLGQHTGGREAMRRARDQIQRLWPHPNPALGLGTTAQMSSLVPAICRVLGPLCLVTTTEEHEGALAGWARHPGVELVLVPPEALLDTIHQRRPELVLVSHVNWTEGRRVELEPVLQAAPGWVIVDVAQSLGLHEGMIRGDIVVGSFHKWLAGPAGSGVSFFSARAREALGATSWAGHSVDPDAPAPQFEPAGTQDFSLWAGLDAALSLYRAIGPSRALARVRALSEAFAAALPAALARYRLRFFDGARWTPEPAVSNGGVVVAHFGDDDPYPLYQRLEACGLHVKCIKGSGRNQLRFGLHWSETTERLAHALAVIAQEGAR